MYTYVVCAGEYLLRDIFYCVLFFEWVLVLGSCGGYWFL